MSAMLDAAAIKKRSGRFELFISHIMSSRPFYTADGNPVVILESEAARMQSLYGAGLFRGAITLTDIAMIEWPLSKFLKTHPFGQAIPPGMDTADIASSLKESLKVKPSQIGITDMTIAGAKLHDIIVNNTELASTDYGRVIIGMASQIASGTPATIPVEMLRQKDIVSAITDYAGEYLGLLSIIHNTSHFPRKKEFLNWAGCKRGTKSLKLTFPSKANTPLADSYASVKITDTTRINISSKGQRAGAAPSLNSLLIPDSLRNNPKYGIIVNFIDICQDKTIQKPTSVSQVFLAMNMLAEHLPELVPPEFNKVLPWPASITADVMRSITEKSPMPQYAELTAMHVGDTADGGKLAYLAKKAVMSMINSGKIPEFREAILEILDYDFLQQYTDIDRKTGQLTFHTHWPAKDDGIVTLESKSGSTNPTKGSFSFRIKPSVPLSAVLH